MKYYSGEYVCCVNPDILEKKNLVAVFGRSESLLNFRKIEGKGVEGAKISCMSRGS